MRVGVYLGLLEASEKELVDTFRVMAEHHRDDRDIAVISQMMAGWSQQLVESIGPMLQRYGMEKEDEPEQLKTDIFRGPRKGPLGTLRDLHDLWLLINEADISWMVLLQSAKGLRDREFIQVCEQGRKQTKRQLDWTLHRLEFAAPQALVVGE